MTAALLDHLWQSSLFALGAWVVTLLLRRNDARLRHAVWLAASIKFLIPFSWLALLGEQLRPFAAFVGSQEPTMRGAGEIARLLASPAVLALPAEPRSADWLFVAGIVWLVGFLVLAIRWLALWHRARSLARSAEPTTLDAPVPVRRSSTLREPGVVGILRPVLLLPTGIESRLTPQQLQSILKHELCHVRRRDNLTAAIHMLVEALFWFHPLVWWIGARLLDERERACDEAVVRSGNDPGEYAEGIIKVCRSHLASDLACVSGVSGADLKTRLEAIMKNDDVRALSGGRKFLLGLLAVAAVAAPILVGLTMPVSASAGGADAKASTAATNSVGKIELLAGKRVKLNYKNVEVRSLLKAMAEAAQVNMLVSDQVSGNVTLDLAETSWDQALDIILQSQGLEKKEQNGILIIGPASARKALAMASLLGIAEDPLSPDPC
jgi:beta-lactamase regulating signal transducer with metallopeptidase domain